MSLSRFPSLAALLSGGASASAISAAQEPPEGDGNTLNVGQLEAAMAVEVDKATATATKSANDRWSKVMSSKEGSSNVKAAARMLNTSAMSADDIIATLGDLADDKDAAAGDQRRGSAGTDRNRLAGSGNRQQQARQRDDEDGDLDDANPDTRGANAGRGGDRDPGTSAREHRKRTAEARNGQTTRAAGGEANVRGGQGGYQPQH